MTTRKRELGQNLIEFALLTPVVLLFIGAIVVFGLAFNARASVQQAMREGARQAAVGASLTEVQSLAQGNAEEWIDSGSWVHWCHPLNTVPDPDTRGRVGDSVQVYVFTSGAKGVPFTIVPANGIFSAFGVGALTVRLNPVATARLEKSVAPGAVDDTCNN
jgi:hypothetical protein